jgi:hypothetical protein
MKILFEFTPCGLDATRSSMVSTERQIDKSGIVLHARFEPLCLCSFKSMK